MRRRDVGHLSPLARSHRAQSPRRDARARLASGVREDHGRAPEPRGSSRMNPPRVGVIGGGLAGIAAALTLADAGAQVTLFERRPHLGGLTSSIERDGFSFDNGQHVFLGCCSSYRAFIERIGASDQIYLQPRLDVPVLSPDGGRGSIRRYEAARARCISRRRSLRYRFLSLRERLGLLRAVIALRRLT